jgi:transposase
MAITDGNGIPIAARIERASPAEVTLVHETLDSRWVRGMPLRILGDKAYDSDKLDAELAERGIEMICPNKINRIKHTQDGRPLRRYKRRWKVERAFAWLNQFRRTVTRWEMYSFNFRGFVEMACMVIMSRSFLR